MTGTELIARVISIVDDTSFSDAVILGYLNDGLFDVASTVKLPDLAALATVDTVTDGDSVALPAGYMRGLDLVYSVTNEVIISDPGRAYDYLKFRRRHPAASDGSSVTDIAIRGKTLYYYPTPSAAETIQLAFFENPTAVIAGTEPTCLPDHLHSRLLCSYAAWRIFLLIEDGVEGQQVNVDRQLREYQIGLAALQEYVGAPDAEPVFIADDYKV